MRCLLCGKRLALLRKLTDGEFCSSAHRKRYVEEEQNLALARLVDEGKRSERGRSPRRPDAVQAGNQRAEETAGFRPIKFDVAPGTFSPAVRPQPLEQTLQTCLIDRSGRGTAATRPLHALQGELVEYQPHISATAPEPGVAGSPAGPLLPALQPCPIVHPVSPHAARPQSAGLTELAPREPRDSARASVRRPKASIFLKLIPPTAPSAGGLGRAQPGQAPLLLPDRWDTAEATHRAITLAGPAAFPPGAASIGPSEARELRVTGIAAETTLRTDLVAASGELAPAVTWQPLARAGAKSQARWQSLPNEWLTACLCYPLGRPARPESTPAKASSAQTEITLAGLARERVAGAGPVAEPLLIPAPVTPCRDVALPDPSPDGAGLVHPDHLASDHYQARRVTPRSECFGETTAHPSSAALPAPALEGQADSAPEALSPAPLPAAMRCVDSRVIPPVAGARGPSRRTSFKAAMAVCPELQAVDLPDPAPLLAAARCTVSRAIFPVLAAQSPSWDTSLKAAIAPCPELQAVDLPDPAPLRAATRRMDCRVFLPVPAAQGPACRTSLNAAIAPCPELRAVDLPDPAPGVPRPTAMTAGLLPPLPPDVAWHLVSSVRVAPPAELAALVALKWPFAPRRPARTGRECSFALQPPAKPLTPRLRLGTILSTRSESEIREAITLAGMDGRMAPWMAVSRFWKTAPADLKWLSVALPAVLLVALVSAVGWLPSKPLQTASQAQASRPNQLQDVVQRTSALVRRNIGSRAAVNLQDDFRSGLGEWEGRGNWGKGWQFDPAGFVLTGPLALFRPSLELTDYRFEFLGQIDKKSLNWVFRAADHNNYYAMKIVLLNTGPLAKAVIQRYAVIDGKPDRVVQTALPMTTRNDAFLRVRVEVRGQNFTTSLQEGVVDFWSDDRLGRGGVGFFSDKGERARLRWVEVSHQYDAVGRLCALLAPYSIQPGNGSLDRQ